MTSRTGARLSTALCSLPCSAFGMPMRWQHQAHTRLLRYAGLFAWACVGIPLVLRSLYFADSLSGWDYAAWWGSYLAFGLAYWMLSAQLGRAAALAPTLLMLAVMSGAAILISQVTQTGLGGILLLVVAGVLPWLVSMRIGLPWLVLQNLGLIPVFRSSPDFDLLSALLQSGLYLGFSSFTFVASLVARRQAEAREELRKVNAELRATRALLADSTRVAERLRISRELHDLIGHHLTALSLNLEVASHLSSGPAREHVLQAQALARLLLADVREVVSNLREGDPLDLRAALELLVEAVPRPEIHLDFDPALRLDDPERAHVVLRCAQELITNAVRHAQAANLWLRISEVDGQVCIDARDDGQGAARAKPGHGLAGMLERLRGFGGDLSITTAPGQGFRVRARLPLASPGEAATATRAAAPLGDTV